jgi:cytochrome c peroxidase
MMVTVLIGNTGKIALLLGACGLSAGCAPELPVELPAAVQNADYYYDGAPPAALVALGRNLFFDKLLSGNKNIACATCHHPDAHTGDGLSLPLGEGGIGLGTARTPGHFPTEVRERVGRNSQPLFNVGAREFTRLFHDGRVEVVMLDQPVFATPAGDDLPAGLHNVLAAQAMMPVVSTAEMAGDYGENPIANAAALREFARGWELLADRLRDPANGYVDSFIAAFEHIEHPEDIRFVDAANALAAFQTAAWRSDTSPFDAYLRGDEDALNEAARRGMKVFFGRGGCARCHGGPFLTDHDFHSIGLPQIGPGKGNGFDGHEDFGREQVTGRREHRYKFRTPSLRNVALTGPWGHNGAYATLRDILLQHLDAGTRTSAYQSGQAVLPSRADLDAHDWLVHSNPARRELIAASADLGPLELTDLEVDDLLEFLDALTDPAARNLGNPPERVPSGLPVSD